MGRTDVVLLTPAQRELEEIARVHLALVGPNAARKRTDAIYDALEHLRLFPLSGAVPRDRWMREMGYRFVVCGKYLCLYRMIDDVLYVYHIVHGASDYPRHLKELNAPEP